MKFKRVLFCLFSVLIVVSFTGCILEAESAFSWDDFVGDANQAESINVQSGSWFLGQVDALEAIVKEIVKKYPDTLDTEVINEKIASFRKSAGRLPRVSADLESEFNAFQKEVLLKNPELNFEDVIYRQSENPYMVENWLGNSSMPKTGYNNEIRSFVLRAAETDTLLVNPGVEDAFLGDMIIGFDADKVMYSSISEKGNWELFEVKLDDKTVRQVSTAEYTSVDNFNGIYLPDGRILFCSTATMVGVPCVDGVDHVANLYVMNADGTGIRQLTYEQDADWWPYVMNSGKVMYLRWEYTDNSHYFTRVLMSMNPDGTEQKALYGSNSYWPNSLFYAKPLPGKDNQFIGIVSGHHGTARAGELYLFDTTLGHREGDGAVMRIGHANKEPRILIRDNLVDNIWPKYLHPFPLTDDTFLVASQTSPTAKWAIYMVDTYGNRVLIKESDKFHLFEPIPVEKRKVPPIIPDRVDTDKETSIVYIQDLYTGEGLRHIPRGTVKQLRISTYAYTLRNFGNHNYLGVESAWDGKIMLGVVDVEKDGSVIFEMPANLPITIQPLDKDGAALQLMRSWTTAMPGEYVSCIGCHEQPSDAPTFAKTLASAKEPQQLQRTFEVPVGIGFETEIQPILDQNCISCHDGRLGIPDFKDTKKIGKYNFSKSYHDLHPYVRRPGPESDFMTLKPMEYHVSTSELVQMLEDGHKGVELDPLEERQLYRWIDLNVPYYPNYRQVFENRGKGAEYVAVETKAYEIRKAYNSHVVDNSIDPATVKRLETEETVSRYADDINDYDVEELLAALREEENRENVEIEVVERGGKLVLSSGTAIMELVEIFSGENTFTKDNRTVILGEDLYVTTTEVTNQFYNLYNPSHDSRYYDQQWKDHIGPGYPANRPNQPVIRISWYEANLFCEWLSEKTGMTVRLLTEDEWMYVAAAGSETEFFFGGDVSNYGLYANLADRTLVKMAVTGVDPQPTTPTIYNDFLPRDRHVKDGRLVATGVGTYYPNPFGLHEIHGNVSEWVMDNDDGKVLAKGGSFSDRQFRSGVSARQKYEPWQKVFNVGFRFCIEED